MSNTKTQIKSLVTAAVVMAIGLLIFKFLPMKLFGNDILFDASLHITTACFILYVVWYFVDQNKNWRIPFLAFAVLVLAIISFQRIVVNAHNDIGLLGGLSLSLFAIIVSRPDYFKKKFHF